MCLSNSKAVCVRKILKQCLHRCVYKILKQYVSREYVLKFLSRFRSFLPAGHLELQLQAKVWHIVHPSVSLGWSKRIKVAPVLSSWAGIKTLMKDTLRRPAGRKHATLWTRVIHWRSRIFWEKKMTSRGKVSSSCSTLMGLYHSQVQVELHLLQHAILPRPSVTKNLGCFSSWYILKYSQTRILGAPLRVLTFT